MGDKDKARQLLDAGDLIGAGRELGLDPVMRSRGHAFDESKDSYARRLMAELVGAHAAGAIVRGEEPMQDPDDDDYPQESSGDEKEKAGGDAPAQTSDGTPAPDAPVVATEDQKDPDQAPTEPPLEGTGGKPDDTPEGAGVAANVDGGADQNGGGDPNATPTEQLP